MKHLDQPFDVIIQKRLGPDLMWVTVVAESPIGRACDATSSAAAVEGSQLARGVAGENLTTGRRPIKKRFVLEDVDFDVLERIARRGWQQMAKRYPD